MKASLEMQRQGRFESVGEPVVLGPMKSSSHTESRIMKTKALFKKYH